MILDELRIIGVLRTDGSFNVRAGMSLAKNSKHTRVWKKVLTKTSFLQHDVSVAQRIHALVNNLDNLILCSTCNSNQPRFVSFKQGYKTFCSPKCAQTNKTTRDKAKQTNTERYGSHYPCGNVEIEYKRRATCRSRFNSPTPFESKKIQQKVRQTIIDKYGVTSTALVQAIAERQKQTRRKTLGVDFPFQNHEVQSKVNTTHLTNFGNIRYSGSLVSNETIKKLNDKDWLYNQHHTEKTPLVQIAYELDVSDVTVGNYLHGHKLKTHYFHYSSGERDVLKFISSIIPNTEIQSNNRSIISPHELDIYIPSKNLAIEYCGLYWHSEQQGKHKWYHYNKWNECNKKGIQLITIFEDEWIYRSKQVKAKLKSLLGVDDRTVVYARNCFIENITRKQKSSFFEQHHIQGNGPGSITLGLYIDEDLVACMSFIQHPALLFYLNRYASSCRVVGGFGKLLKHFQSNFEFSKIISFADRRWSNGNLYNKTGWEESKHIPPDYCYKRGDKRIHKFNYRRKYLPRLLNNFNPELSEKKNCDNHGILRIWDCGKLRYTISEETYNNAKADS